MSRLRTLLVACLTFAVATLPVAGTLTSLAMADAAPGADMPCSEHTEADRDRERVHDGIDRTEPGLAKSHCIHHAACAGNCLCLALTAVLPSNAATPAAHLPRPSTIRIAVDLGGPAYIPPSPPPRV